MKRPTQFPPSHPTAPTACCVRAASAYLVGDSVGVPVPAAPVPAADRDDGHLGDDDGATDGSGNLLHFSFLGSEEMREGGVGGGEGVGGQSGWCMSCMRVED